MVRLGHKHVRNVQRASHTICFFLNLFVNLVVGSAIKDASCWENVIFARQAAMQDEFAALPAEHTVHAYTQA